MVKRIEQILAFVGQGRVLSFNMNDLQWQSKKNNKTKQCNENNVGKTPESKLGQKHSTLKIQLNAPSFKEMPRHGNRTHNNADTHGSCLRRSIADFHQQETRLNIETYGTLE